MKSEKFTFVPNCCSYHYFNDHFMNIQVNIFTRNFMMVLNIVYFGFFFVNEARTKNTVTANTKIHIANPIAGHHFNYNGSKIKMQLKITAPSRWTSKKFH